MRMKNLLLAVCGFILFVFAVPHVSAQEPAYKADVYIAPYSVETGDGMFGTIFGVSSNGEYAVGTDDIYYTGCFLWTKQTREFTSIDGAEYVNDVANDGTCVGAFYKETLDGDVTSVPGYYKDGKWTELPLPSDKLYAGNMNGMAVAISADGKYIAGYVPAPEGFMFIPIVWENGAIKDTFANVKVLGQGWCVKGMSDDGRIVAGYAEWGSGARSSAVIIDGQEIRLTCTEDPVELELEGWIDAEGHAKVSANGKHCAGYYADSANGTGLKGWCWNPVVSNDTKELLFLADNTMCLCVDNNGIAYGCDSPFGAACSFKDGVATNLATLYNIDSGDAILSAVQDCSDDGKVLGGLAVVYKDGAMTYFPYVIVLSENGDGAVADVVKEKNTAVIRGNDLHIGGSYQAVYVYNASGLCVASDNTGRGVVPMGNMPAGVYLVKIIGGDGGSTFKVVK